jgi:antitoxin (DNA-binding transcriptional repressor) of toxin-antitoxin stability system
MKTIAASEAETRFGALLQDDEKGETVIVTRDGQPVARVSPV